MAGSPRVTGHRGGHRGGEEHYPPAAAGPWRCRDMRGLRGDGEEPLRGEWAESCNIYVYFRIFWKIMGGRWIFPAMLMSGRQVGLKRLKNPERNECNQAI